MLRHRCRTRLRGAGKACVFLRHALPGPGPFPRKRGPVGTIRTRAMFHALFPDGEKSSGAPLEETAPPGSCVSFASMHDQVAATEDLLDGLRAIPFAREPDAT